MSKNKDVRELIELFCNDCNGYFHVNLNLSIEGDFRFECPQCGRRHPRTVRAGEVVGDVIERIYKDGVGKRLSRNHGEDRGELIMVPKSAYTKKSILKDIETANGENKEGFLASLWARSVHGEK
jgi:hypothetical protein